MRGTKRFLSDESGASAVEYALIIAVVTTAVGAAALFLGGSIANAVNNSASYMGIAPSS